MISKFASFIPDRILIKIKRKLIRAKVKRWTKKNKRIEITNDVDKQYVRGQLIKFGEIDGYGTMFTADTKITSTPDGVFMKKTDDGLWITDLASHAEYNAMIKGPLNYSSSAIHDSKDNYVTLDFLAELQLEARERLEDLRAERDQRLFDMEADFREDRMRVAREHEEKIADCQRELGRIKQLIDGYEDDKDVDDG